MRGAIAGSAAGDRGPNVSNAEDSGDMQPRFPIYQGPSSR